jgi:hypothetical protein
MNRIIKLCYSLVIVSTGLWAGEWVPVNPGPGPAIWKLQVAKDHLYAVSSTGVWRYAHGGVWTPLYHPTEDIYSFWTDDSIGMVSFKDTSLESRVSADAGLTWNNVQYMPHFITSFGKFGDLYIGASTFSYLKDYGPHVDSRCCQSSTDFYITYDAAGTWSYRNKIYEDLDRYSRTYTTSLAVHDGSITALVVRKTSYYTSGSLYGSTDTGKSWVELPFGMKTVTQLISNDTAYYAIADTGILYKSSDAGWHWDTLGTPAGKKVGDAILAMAEGRVMYGTESRVYALAGDSLDWTGIETREIPAPITGMVFFDGKLWVGTGSGIFTYPIREEASTRILTDAKKPPQHRLRTLRARGIFIMPDDSHRGLNGRLKP